MSSREGCNPAGESAAASVARNRRVVMPRPGMGNREILTKAASTSPVKDYRFPLVPLGSSRPLSVGCSGRKCPPDSPLRGRPADQSTNEQSQPKYRDHATHRKEHGIQRTPFVDRNPTGHERQTAEHEQVHGFVFRDSQPLKTRLTITAMLTS
jgi:hypothetical protein